MVNSPNKLWTRLLGSNGDDAIVAIATGLDGSIYVSGYTDASLDGQTNSGGLDAFITKYSADGTKVWTHLLGTSSGDQARALTTGLDGSIYVGGYIAGNLDGQANSGGQDVFVTKYNPEGTKVWTRLLGTSSGDQARALTTGLDGSIYVGGYTAGNLDGQANSGAVDGFVTKYNPDGTKVWTRLIGTSGADYANALTKGLDGSIYVGGYTYGSLDGQTNSGGADAFVSKYSADGTKIWTRLLGTSSSDIVNALTTGLDGSIYVGGYTYGSLDGQTNSGGADAFVSKYSADGTKIWTRLLGTSGTDTARALMTGLDGSIYVSGDTLFNLDGQANNNAIGSTDGFVTKYNPDGTKVWTRLIGTSGVDYANALTKGLDGSIYVGGYTYGALDGQATNGGVDAFLVKFSEAATYALSTDTTSVNEGTTVTFKLTTTNVALGTSVAYTLSGISVADITGGLLTGTAVIDAQGEATISVAIAADSLTEGAESLTLTAQGTSASVVINDTSLSPIPSPNKLWTRILGSIDFDFANAITTGLDGAIYMSGSTYGSLDGQTSSGSIDAFVTKFKPDGTKVWTRQLGAGPEGLEALAITAGPDGSIYIGGYTGPNLDGQSTSASNFDAFVIKYSPDGARVWTRVLNSSNGATTRALSTGLDGSVYVVGHTVSNLDDQANNGMVDAFITQYSSDGTKTWTRLLGTSGIDQARAVTRGLDGSIYVGGFTSGDLDGQANKGGFDAFVTKYNSDGTKVWTQLVGTGGNDYAYALTTALDGFIYVCGTTNDNLDGNTSNGGQDAFVSKFNPDGTKVWTRLLGSIASESGLGLTAGLDGSI